MGYWKMTIDGHGIHDNGKEDDADAMLQDFLDKLSEAGHEELAGRFEIVAPARKPRVKTS